MFSSLRRMSGLFQQNLSLIKKDIVKSPASRTSAQKRTTFKQSPQESNFASGHGEPKVSAFEENYIKDFSSSLKVNCVIDEVRDEKSIAKERSSNKIDISFRKYQTIKIKEKESDSKND